MVAACCGQPRPPLGGEVVVMVMIRHGRLRPHFGVRCRLVPCAVVLSLCEPVGPVPEVPLGQIRVLPDHDDVFTGRIQV